MVNQINDIIDNQQQMKNTLLLIFFILMVAQSKIQLYHLIITPQTDAFTIPFPQTFYHLPSFSYFIQFGLIENIEFSITHNPLTTIITKSQITISFIITKSFTLRGTQKIGIALLISDEEQEHFQTGVKVVNISSSIVMQFKKIVVMNNGMKRASMKLYSLGYPVNYQQVFNQSLGEVVQLQLSKYPVSFNQMAFSYIYYSIEYVGYTVFATYSQINQQTYNFQVLYDTFAFHPSDQNVFFAMRDYESSTSPFYSIDKYVQYRYMDITDTTSVFLLGCNLNNGFPTHLRVDVIVFNNSYTSIAGRPFLNSLILYETLPLSSSACHSDCLTCSSNQTLSPQLTDNNSCSSCSWLEYLNKSQGNSGNCVCHRGLSKSNEGKCQQCSSSCLLFDIQFIQFTQYAIFLLRFSEIDIHHLIPLQQNLIIDIEGVNVAYQVENIQTSIYSIKISNQNMKFCTIKQCHIDFSFVSPAKIESFDRAKTLQNTNQTVIMKNYIQINNYLPYQLAQVFQIFGLSVGVTYTGGYSSLMKILFQSEQLINIHRYLNLQLPIIFNQFVNEMQNFRFLDLTNLFPNNIKNVLSNMVTNKLDNKGPSKLTYYDSGVNFYKNSVIAILSCLVMFIINLLIYFILYKVPTEVTRKLAKKIRIRKIITVHDTLEQLQLPLMHYALEQLQISILTTEIIWIYGLAVIVALSILTFPFMVIIYIYLNRKDETKKQIFQDIMQDNKMDKTVTYIYYVFNYYRKICFAAFLLSSIPGLIQIYLLITINTIHLSFQIYLIAKKVYLNLAKVIVRFINSFCVIFLEILIVLYNINNFKVGSMVTIGLMCVYISLVTTILCILDFIIKLSDTIFQQIKSKQKENAQNAVLFKIQEQLIRQINCNIGNELAKSSDKKQQKFKEDKELMEQTFQERGGSSEQESNSQENNNKKDMLVYIDDDWMNMYPADSAEKFMPKKNKKKHVSASKYDEDKYQFSDDKKLNKYGIKQTQEIDIGDIEEKKSRSFQNNIGKKLTNSRNVKKIEKQLKELADMVKNDVVIQPRRDENRYMSEQSSQMHSTSKSKRQHQTRIKRSQKLKKNRLIISKIKQSKEEEDIEDIVSQGNDDK